MVKENDVIGIILALYVAVGALLAICYCRFRPTAIGPDIEGGSSGDSEDGAFSYLSLSSRPLDSSPKPPTNPPTGPGTTGDRIRVPPATDRISGLRVPTDTGKGGGPAVKRNRGREGGLRVPPDAGIVGDPGVPRFVGRGSGIRVPKSPGTSG